MQKMKYDMKKYIDNYDTISFDIFDTLIGRDVETPACIFELAASTIFDETKAKEFRRIRYRAEESARAKRIDREINLLEIYEELVPHYKNLTDRLLRAEIDCEISHCFRIDEYANLLNELVKKKKKVFLISDMYLPQSVIMKMLDKCRISGYERIYVSGKERCNKVSGQLFEKVITDNHIERKKMLHIGDSFRADVQGAHKAGIKSKWVFDADKYLRRVWSLYRKHGK